MSTQAEATVGNEPDFIARIAAGDRMAEAEFVRRYQRGVLVLVRRHCRPGDPIVDDIAQDVLARVLERLRAGAIRDAAALPAYVQATVSHQTLAEYRSRRVVETSEILDSLPAKDTPIDQLRLQQLQETLNALLAELPVARDRELLKRFYLWEQEKEQVCRDLAIDADHFHRVVFRARERFRAVLEKNGLSGENA